MEVSKLKMKFKQAIVLRNDINISEGKRIAQACHASLKSYKKSDNDVRSEWESEGAKKVALEYSNLEELKKKSDRAGLPAALIKDAGLTELEPGTITALGIGPAEESKIDTITGELSLIK